MSSTRTEELGIPVGDIIRYLQGAIPAEGFDIVNIAKTQADDLAKSMTYFTHARTRKKYHRQSMNRAVVCLITYGPSYYRQVAWAIIQKIPLSFLVEITKQIENNTKENTTRLRHAILSKICRSTENDIFRAFFINPGLYRKMFEVFHFPNDNLFGIGERIGSYKFKLKTRHGIIQKTINHLQYLHAITIVELGSMEKVMKHYEISPGDLVKKYKIPLENVFQFVKTKKQAKELLVYARGDSFFEHARWFKDLLGKDTFKEIAKARLTQVKDTMRFTRIEQHLKETKTFDDELMTLIKTRTKDIVDELLKEYNLTNIAILVDLSPSMKPAQELAKKLYDAFHFFGENIIQYLIGFEGQAFGMTPERLKAYPVGQMGATSVGAAFTMLYQNITTNLSTKASGDTNIPQVIIVISDMDENTPPFVNKTVFKSGVQTHFGRQSPPLGFDTMATELFREWNIPVIILYCGPHKLPIEMDYPHAIMTLEEFHDDLLMDIIKEIVKFGAQVIKEPEKKITQVVGQRKLVEEELGNVTLPERSEDSLRKGYMFRLLTSG